MTSHDHGEIRCWTDGSCVRNGYPDAKGASAVCFPDGEMPDGAYHLPPTSVRSNNRTEYYAAIKAMQLVNECDPGKAKTLHVYTDSLLLVNTCTKWMHSWQKRDWKKSGGEIKNLDLVKTLYEQCRARNVKWTHVKAHTGGTDFNSVWNDRVDKLAYSAVHDDPGAFQR